MTSETALFFLQTPPAKIPAELNHKSHELFKASCSYENAVSRHRNADRLLAKVQRLTAEVESMVAEFKAKGN